MERKRLAVHGARCGWGYVNRGVGIQGWGRGDGEGCGYVNDGDMWQWKGGYWCWVGLLRRWGGYVNRGMGMYRGDGKVGVVM